MVVGDSWLWLGVVCFMWWICEGLLFCRVLGSSFIREEMKMRSCGFRSKSVIVGRVG